MTDCRSFNARAVGVREPSADKVAGYGLAALVGGVAASKAGLFAKPGVLRLKIKNLAILLVVGIGYLLTKVLKRSKPEHSKGGGR
jgi:uncharacterized membrane-anchored protein